MQGLRRTRRLVRARVLCTPGALVGAVMAASIVWLIIFGLVPQWADWQRAEGDDDVVASLAFGGLRRGQRRPTDGLLQPPPQEAPQVPPPAAGGAADVAAHEDEQASAAGKEKDRENQQPPPQQQEMEDADHQAPAQRPLQQQAMEIGGGLHRDNDGSTPGQEQQHSSEEEGRDGGAKAPVGGEDSMMRERGHVFYYPWYDNPQHNKDKEYLHWNHEVLANPFRQGSSNGAAYVPPEQIGANFYPQLGCYSSTDPSVIRQHMEMIRKAGLGVITVSWYPPAYSDGQIQSNPGFSDATLASLLDIANEHGIKVNLHIEPYAARSEASVASDIRYVVDKYGEHPAFYRHHRTKLPMFYVYDSYHTDYKDWAKVLGSPAEHPDSIRGTKYDAMMIALFVGAEDYQRIPQGGFDGVYTYFATDGFTHGSSTVNWARLSSWAEKHGMIFIPSVGPGYEDTRIRPWNAQNSRSREDGKYYDRMMNAALRLERVPEIVSVTSWNEWHEGTQIEPAVPKVVQAVPGQWPEYAYMDYAPHEPDHYLRLTQRWMAKFEAKWRSAEP